MHSVIDSLHYAFPGLPLSLLNCVIRHVYPQITLVTSQPFLVCPQMDDLLIGDLQ
jgi:hypothetical protein